MRYFIGECLGYGEYVRYRGYEYTLYYKPIFKREYMPAFVIEETEDFRKIRREYLTGIVINEGFDNFGSSEGKHISKGLNGHRSREVSPKEFEQYLSRYSEKQKQQYAKLIRQFDEDAKKNYRRCSEEQEAARKRLTRGKKY